MRGPKHYRSLEEFEREEISPQMKMGWSLDDLYAEAKFTPARDDSLEEDEPEELNFDF